MNNIDELVNKALTFIQTEQLFSKENLMKTVNIAVKKAEEMKVPITVCISDLAGNPRIIYRMPEAKLVSLTLAPKKANSALMLQAPTKELNKDTLPGGELYNMETMMDGRLVTFAGGIPLVIHERIIGAIGCSGGTVDEDHMICQTAVRYFLEGRN